MHAQRDPRVDVIALEYILGKLPEDEREQNKTWYRLYKSVESDPGVAHNHRDYLFTRDYATLAMLFLIIWVDLRFTSSMNGAVHSHTLVV